jgi:hypothetical protein
MLAPVSTIVSTIDRCAACGAPLTDGYYYLHDRPERYCANCITGRPRCDGCAAPVGNEYWTLHDGRVMCARCHATAIYDPAVAQQLYEETIGAVIAQLGLKLRRGVVFRLVDAPTLEQVRNAGGSSEPGQRTLGLYQRQGNLRIIYALYGLPKLTFRIVVAHEYAHAWQDEECPHLEDDGLREGFAEWVAYRHLLYLGCTKAAQRMLSAPHPYQPLLQQFVTLEQRSGPAAAVDLMLAAGQGKAVTIES